MQVNSQPSDINEHDLTVIKDRLSNGLGFGQNQTKPHSQVLNCCYGVVGVIVMNRNKTSKVSKFRFLNSIRLSQSIHALRLIALQLWSRQ